MRRNHRAESPPERGSSHATPRWGIAALLLPVAFGAGNVGVAEPPPDDPVRVVIETEMGAFELEVDVGRAPRTASNFLRYLDGGHYDGGTFFRTVHADNQPGDSIRIAVIQGGRNPDAAADPFPAIALERTSETGLRHVDGAVSMGRTGPDTATDSFFICIGDQPSLDFGGMRNPDGQGFAAFGRVIDGMDVVRAIHAAPYEAQRLTPPVEIGRAYRKE
ncbi:MAG: peptidylprolyl isomerase [Acidobacteria bacterium]|nr:peptidylprolyl isomerase [Acidobacteriota bacterium]